MVLLESASGLRPGELLALKVNDIDFNASTVRVDEALPRKGEIGPCKNAAACRTVLLHDVEGQKAMQELKRFLEEKNDPDALVFRTKHDTPVQETTVLKQCLHPATKALGLPKAGMRALRRGCNRRWELAGINPAVPRQQMGHSSSAMTELHGRDTDRAEYSKQNTGLLENMENGSAS